MTTNQTTKKAPAKKAETKVSASSQPVKKATPKQETPKKTAQYEVAGKPLSIRGRQFVGEVISDRMAKTVSVRLEWKKAVPKFERFTKKRNTIKAHNPEEIDAKIGDRVRIQETRPISKTKHFVVTEVIKQ